MSSASAQSLLGLMSQLQSLESSFISVLMEAALKLSAITDTSVFLMVETKEGRRISGKRHLCDSYLRGELIPVGDDVVYDVDPSIVALQQRHPSAQREQQSQQQLHQQLQQRHSGATNSHHSFGSSLGTFRDGDYDGNSHLGSPLPSMQGGGGRGGNGNNYDGENPLKRPSNSLVSAVPLPTKQSRLSHNCVTPRPTREWQQSIQHQPQQISALDDAAAVKLERSDIFKVEQFPPSPSHSIAAESAAAVKESVTASAAVSPTTNPDSSVNDDDDDSDIAEIIEEHPVTMAMATTTTSRMNDATGSLVLVEDDTSVELLKAYQSNVPFQIPVDFAKKMEALQSMRTTSVFEKLSIEHRLFTSCVYQLGSLLAKHVVAYAAEYQSSNLVEDFFNHHVTLWLSNFPYLYESESRGLRVDTGKGGMTINGFVRHRARNSFRKGCLVNANKANLTVSE